MNNSIDPTFIYNEIRELESEVTSYHFKNKGSLEGLAKVQDFVINVINNKENIKIYKDLENIQREIAKQDEFEKQGNVFVRIIKSLLGLGGRIKLENKKKEIEERIDKMRLLVDYAKNVQNRIEIVQRQMIMDQKYESEEKKISTVSLIDLVRLCKNKYKLKVTNLIVLWDKYLGNLPDNNFTVEDAKRALELDKIIDDLIKKNGDAAELKQIKTITDKIKNSIKECVVSKLDMLNDKNLDKIEQLAKKYSKLDNAEKLELYKLFHNIYWDFNCPFDHPMTFSDLKEMIKNKDGLLPLFNGIKEDTLSDVNNRLRRLEIIEKSMEKLHSSLISKDNVDQANNIKELQKNKTEYLKMKRDENVKKFEDPLPKVLIIGGGPGGLIRALTAGLKGTEVEVMEKRSDYTRKNMIKLPRLSVLEYFGIADRLIYNNKIMPDEGKNMIVSINSLEEAMDAALQDFLPNTIQKEKELVDVRVSEDTKGKMQAGCLIRDISGKESTWHPADIIVDSSGTSAVVAKAIGNVELEELTKSSMMVAAVFEKSSSDTQTRDTGPEIHPWGVRFEDPEKQYILVRPSEKAEKELMQLHTLLHEVRKHISEAGSKTDVSDLEQRKADLESQLTLLSEKIAREKAAEKPDFVGDPNTMNLTTSGKGKKDVTAFQIQVTARHPAITVGDTLIMQSGDSLHTPDPMAGIGCVMALMGGTVFSHSLDELKDPSISLPERYQNYIYSSDIHTDFLVERSAIARTKRNEQSMTDTVDSSLRKFKRKGWLTEEEVTTIKNLSRRKNDHISFSESDWQSIDSLNEQIDDIFNAISTHDDVAFKNEWLEIVTHLN